MTALEHLGDPDTLRESGSAFYDLQRRRLSELGIDVSDMAVSHLAIRTPSWRTYLVLRSSLEEHAMANLENIWNGRPISKILLSDPIPVAEHDVDLIELIPPFHQRVYSMGLEHVGFVVGAGLDDFVEQHVAVLTGRQFQTPDCRPAYRLFDDYTHVKFYRRSLRDECVREGATFDRVVHTRWDPEDLDAGPYAAGSP